MSEAERIIKLETQMENLDKKVEDGFREGTRQHEEMKKVLNDFIEKSESRFASKWVEKAVWGAAALICTSVVGAILALVIK